MAYYRLGNHIMNENDIVLLNEPFVLSQQTISIQDIIGAENAVYMNLILLSSACLFVYVIWMNFFFNSKYQKWLDSKSIDIHELAILPTIVLVITTLSYKGWI